MASNDDQVVFDKITIAPSDASDGVVTFEIVLEHEGKEQTVYGPFCVEVGGLISLEMPVEMNAPATEEFLRRIVDEARRRE